jgi:RNA polymerase sigma-70 factor (ECF subfamily)
VIRSEAELVWVRDARAGSGAAFALLVRAHQQALRAFLRRLCRNDAEADDLAQETFVFAWEAIHRFDPARSFRAWLMGIGFRKYRESKRGWLRRMTRETHYAEARESSAAPDPGATLDISAALDGLPPDQRAALILCLGQEFSHAEAAEALDLPLGTVKSHVLRGREKLIARLDDGHG